jgi:Transglutaminase-like superfamily
MMHFRLTPTSFVYFAFDSAVILDTKNNQYHGLTGDQAAALQIALGNRTTAQRYPQVSDADVAAFATTLAARGILTTAPVATAGCRSSVGVPPVHSLDDSLAGKGGRIHARHRVRALHYFLRSAFWLKRGRLDSAIQHLQATKQRRARASTCTASEAISLIRTFDAIRPLLYSSRDKCLLDSLVLAEFLLANGVSATFLIGVRTMPFIAHSWVQIDDCVLNCPLYAAQRSNVIVAI